MADAAAAQDEVLMSLAGKLGGIDPLLKAFFSFLHRKTDFYVQFPREGNPKGFSPKMGFPAGQAESMVARNFKAFPMKDYATEVKKMEDAQAQHRAPVPKTKPSTSSKAKKASPQKKPASAPAQAPVPAPPSAAAAKKVATAASPASPPTPPSSSAGVSTTEGASSSSSSTSSSSSSSSSSPPVAPDAPPPMPTVRLSDRGLQMPVGNGGVTANYYWTQTLYELTAFVYVPRGTRGADLACTISPSRIELRLKKPVDGFGDSEGWLLKGDMPETCRPDESMWMGEFFFGGRSFYSDSRPARKPGVLTDPDPFSRPQSRTTPPARMVWCR